jgi:flavin-dependent dehydrogenase
MRNKKIDLNEKLRKVSSDILVIGGGGAGLRVAIGAHDSGADVLIISKKQERRSPHCLNDFLAGLEGLGRKTFRI